MSQINQSPDYFVEGFVIDDETQEVILCRDVSSPLSLFGGFGNEVIKTPHFPSTIPYFPSPSQPNKEDPLFSLVRLTHHFVNKFIPPNEWIEMGYNQKEDGKRVLLFATSWPMDKLKPHPSIDVIRIPLPKISEHPNTHPHVIKLLSHFG